MYNLATSLCGLVKRPLIELKNSMDLRLVDIKIESPFSIGFHHHVHHHYPPREAKLPVS